jgi:hypothetical protein
MSGSSLLQAAWSLLILKAPTPTQPTAAPTPPPTLRSEEPPNGQAIRRPPVAEVDVERGIVHIALDQVERVGGD